MLAGPWCNYSVLKAASIAKVMPISLDGKRPVAIEIAQDHKARFLYVKPGDEREPLPFRHVLPEYVYCG